MQTPPEALIESVRAAYGWNASQPARDQLVIWRGWIYQWTGTALRPISPEGESPEPSAPIVSVELQTGVEVMGSVGFTIGAFLCAHNKSIDPARAAEHVKIIESALVAGGWRPPHAPTFDASGIDSWLMNVRFLGSGRHAGFTARVQAIEPLIEALSARGNITIRDMTGSIHVVPADLVAVTFEPVVVTEG